MSPPGAPASIPCPIGLYQKQEEEITRFTAAINSSSAVPDKVRAAQDLRRSVSMLLICSAYDESNHACQMCREVALLRDNTA
ncbi:MAG: hypothetical protein JOZ94_01040, partial [Xanthobacteraceae bacterium]|nr:hypothetical protein [Xanthobacteraceae bacterium]